MTQPAADDEFPEARMAFPDVNWWVVCIEGVVGPFVKAEASTRLVEMAQNPGGYSCRRDHHLVQSDTEPEPSYPPDGPQPLPPSN